MTEQQPNSSQRLLAIHDLSGFGHTSLLSVIPILYRMGMEVAVLPSMLLSANTDYPDYRYLDTTVFMQQTLEHWRELGLGFDAVHSGFLGAPEQAGILREAIPQLRKPLAPVLVDPVLGDDGKLYGCYDDKMVSAMRSLIAVSNIITPNLTEAALLLERPYPQDDELVDLKAWGKALSELGPEMVVITSVPGDAPDATRVYCYSRKNDKDRVYNCRYQPIEYPGAGDCFAALLIGGIMNGHSIWKAVEATIGYLSDAIAASMPLVSDRRTGIALARVLSTNPLDYYL